MKGLIRRAKEILSLSRVQAILGIVAATLSIGGALYGYLRPAKPPTTASANESGTDVERPIPAIDAAQSR